MSEKIPLFYVIVARFKSVYIHGLKCGDMILKR